MFLKQTRSVEPADIYSKTEILQKFHFVLLHNISFLISKRPIVKYRAMKLFISM